VTPTGPKTAPLKHELDLKERNDKVFLTPTVFLYNAPLIV
jgi:hypothetical protein